MLLCIIDSFEVSNIDFSASIFIKFLESALYNSPPVVSEISSYDSEELIVLDGSITVDIKTWKHNTHVFTRHLAFEVTTRLLKLWTIQRVRTVVVHYFEDSLKTNDTFGSSLKDFLSEHFNKLFHSKKQFTKVNRTIGC